MLKTIPSINYIGYLEANELLTGKTDVLVCDGFTGNVTLKTMEGVVRMFLSLLKSQGEGKKRSWWLLLLKRWLQKSLTRRFSHLNPDQYNGACLLGLRGTVIKSHGAANQRAFAVAIEQAVQAVQRQVPQRIAARPNLYTQLVLSCWTVAKAELCGSRTLPANSQFASDGI